MKKVFQILFCLFISLSAFAQESIDTIAKKQNKWNKGIFISASINSTQYYSDSFFNYLFNKTFNTTKSANPGSIPSSNYSVYNTNLGKINYNKSSVSPIITMGLELNSGRFKKLKLHHIIEASYMRFSGEYSYSDYYREIGSGGQVQWFANIHDTIQSKYTQTLFSIGYKFQPTYKFIFFSLGINGSVNLIKVDQQKKEQIDGSASDDTGGYYYSKSNNYDITNNIYFINFPLQLGAGGYISMKNMTLKPAFYFTSCFMKGYNFYNISVGILFGLKKH